MADSFLERIVATTQADLIERKARVSLDQMREQAPKAPPARRLTMWLRRMNNSPARLIAEVKRASPSKGMLAETFDPVAQALAYEAGGASVISVLTEPHFFLGSLDHLAAVRANVSLPVLRKDFIIDPYQVYEARAVGADAVLLICALLDDATLRDLLALTRDLGMEALVEAHNAQETERAVAADANVIGVNSRDLRTFAVDTNVVRHLRPLVPDDRVFVAESGITDALGAVRARAWGADAILVGEALMRAGDPTAKARELAAAPGGGRIHSFFVGRHRPFVKLCGLSTREQIALTGELGADAYGLVFAPQAPAHRRLTPDQACVLTGRGGILAHDTNGQWRTIQFARRARRGEPRAVGVFVNEDATTIAHIVEHVGLDAIQLSGDETPAFCAEVTELSNRPVLKALRLRTDADLAALDDYALAGATLLLDAHVPGSYGGSGQTGDWRLARMAADRWPIILSGGLTPENVGAALAEVQPRGVDVSSGIESDGMKDFEKMRRFVAAARPSSPVGGSVNDGAPLAPPSRVSGKGAGGLGSSAPRGSSDQGVRSNTLESSEQS